MNYPAQDFIEFGEDDYQSLSRWRMMVRQFLEGIEKFSQPSFRMMNKSYDAFKNEIFKLNRKPSRWAKVPRTVARGK